MNIYLVKRTDEIDYDEYDSVVVVAESFAEAKRMCPSERSEEYWKNLNVKLIGTARTGMERGIVLDSFNAG